MRGFGLVNGYGMMGGFGMWLVGLLWLLFIVALVVGIVMMSRRMHGHGHAGMYGQGPSATPPAPGHDEAVAIARKRFAAGEITKGQFDEMMKALGN
jgi:uncharacterized membrane protein